MSAMTRRMLSGFLFSLVAVCCASAVVADGPKASSSNAAITRNFGNLPLSFEPNRGQSDPRVKFISRAHTETLFLTQTGATIALTRAHIPDYKGLASRGGAGPGIKNVALKVPSPRVESSSVRMEFVGASGSAKIEGIGRNARVTNYFVGADPKKWHAGIPNYSKVRYTGLYRGIDLVFYGDANYFEYDLIVAPGVNPREVRIRFEGADKLAIDKAGDLTIALSRDDVVLRKPLVYQEHAGKRIRIDGHYVVLDRRTVAFEVGRYDRNSPLVIDPSLTWAKILPGNFLDITNAVATDSASNPYVTGFTCSSDFGANNGPTSAAGTQAGCDAFVTKLSASGSVAYTSIFGGTAFDQGFGIAVDVTGAAYVAGQTFSTDFSLAPVQKAASAAYDAFVIKLDPNGLLLWARVLGGSHPTFASPMWGWSIAFSVAIPQRCTDTCAAYVAGQTSVTDFPTTPGAIQGSFQGVSVNAAEAFLSVMQPDGSGVAYSTYYGAGPDPRNVGGSDWAFGVAADGSGVAYVTGGTEFFNQPTTSGFGSSRSGGVDCWVAKIDTTSATPVYSRFLGGSDYDVCRAIAIDPGCHDSCSAYLSGVTWSADFLSQSPPPSAPFQSSFGGFSDAFVTKLDPSGNITYSTFLGNITGENGESIAVDSADEVYVTGTTGNFFPQFNAVQGAIPFNGSVLKSIEGGVTFSPTNFPVGAGLVSLGGIGIDPVDPATIYVASFETGVQRSTNSGQNFSTFATGNILGVAHDANDPSIFYGGGFNGLFKSTNGGANFNIATNITDEVTWWILDPTTNPSTVYAATSVSARTSNTMGRVYRSTDGINFTQIPGLSATTIFCLALDPNDGTVYAGTSRGLYHTSNFALTGSMSVPRKNFPGLLLPNGKVLVVGGQETDTGPFLASAEIYDPSNGNWSPTTGSMNVARAGAAAVLLGNGKVLVAGGWDGNNYLTSAELYDPLTGLFTPTTGTMTSPTSAPNGPTLGVLLNDGRALILGPGSSSGQLYNTNGTFSSTLGQVVTPRGQDTATLLQDGRVLITGGNFNFNQPLNSAELFDPLSETFSPTQNNMTYAREMHVAAALELPDQRVLIAGGESTSYPGNPVLPAEIFDPATNQFTVTGSMAVPRLGGSAVTLQNGRVLVVSGNGGNTPGNSFTAELYDTGTSGFSTVGTLHAFRLGSPTVLLPSGNVLIAGGHRGPVINAEQTAELFDPNSFGFQLAGNHGVFARPIFSVAVDSTTNPSTVYTADENGVARSDDAFNNLSFIDFNGGGTFYALALDSSYTPAKLYAGNGNGELLSSTDTGDHVLVQNLLGVNPGSVGAVAATSDGSHIVYASINEEFDAFVSKLDMNGQNLLFSSFIGGSQGDFSNGIAVAPDGSAYVTGGTGSGDFNSAAGQLEGRDNPFIAKIPNTLAGSGQTDCISQTCITFPTVVSGGNTVATSSTVGPQLPPGLSLVTGSMYTNIVTTATVVASDSFPITVCFAYNPANVTNPANLSLLHFENGQWINVTTQVDTRADIICGGVTSLSPFAVVIGKPVTVAIQIKPPSSAPVSINLGSNGTTPVAILSTSTFDATKVVPSSIVIDGAKVNLRGKGTYQCSSQDVNGDGRSDLVCQVTTNQIDLIPGSDMAILTATTTSGTPIQGQEAINVVKQ